MMTFIADLPWASKMTPEFTNSLEAFLPEWLESLVPYYKEGKNRGVDIFYLGSFMTYGQNENEIFYESNGVLYYEHHSRYINMLGFDGRLKENYRKCNWFECYCEKHSDYSSSSLENIRNSSHYSSPMHRCFNHRPEEKELAERCNSYFQQITGDRTAGFSLSSTSMIYFTDRGKWYIDKWYRHC